METEINRRFYKDEMLYELRIKKSDVEGLSETQIVDFQKAISNAVAGVCWNFGLHN